MRKYLLYTIFVFLVISCEQKPPNPLLGSWKTEKNISFHLQASHQVHQIEFTKNTMRIDSREIPVIYKQRDNNTMVLFSRGYSVVVHIISSNKISFFLEGIGKNYYQREE